MARSNILVGLLAGAAAGAAAGILLAPGKGSETRKNLSKRSRETVDNLKGKVGDLVDTVADKYFSGEASPAGSRGTDNLERTRSTASAVTGATSPNSFT